MAGPDNRLRRWLYGAAYVLSIFAWLLFSAPRREAEDNTAEYLGRICGAAVFALGLVLIPRFIYWQARGRSRPFWTPLVFVLAAVVALLIKVQIEANEDAGG